MAIYVASTQQYGIGTLAGLPPILPSTGSLFFQFYPTWSKTDGVEHSLFDARKEASSNYFTINKFSNNSLYSGWVTSGGDTRIVIASGSYTMNANAWNTYSYTWSTSGGTTSAVRINGTETASTGPFSVWDTSTANYGVNVGNASGSLANHPAEARFAEVAIWNIELTASQTLQLSIGLSPLFFPAGLVYYNSLIRTPVDRSMKLIDTVGGVAGLTIADHCPVSYPHGGFTAKSGSTPPVTGGPFPHYTRRARSLSGGLITMGL